VIILIAKEFQCSKTNMAVLHPTLLFPLKAAACHCYCLNCRGYIATCGVDYEYAELREGSGHSQFINLCSATIDWPHICRYVKQCLLNLQEI